MDGWIDGWNRFLKRRLSIFRVLRPRGHHTLSPAIFIRSDPVTIRMDGWNRFRKQRLSILGDAASVHPVTRYIHTFVWLGPGIRPWIYIRPHDCVSREYQWRVSLLVTKTSLFTASHISSKVVLSGTGATANKIQCTSHHPCVVIGVST